MKRAFGLFVVSLAACAAAFANVLLNPSFETEGEATDRAQGWERWGDWMNREAEWTPVRDGACIIGYHHWQIDKSDSSGLWQDARVEPGRKYVFSIFANADQVTNGAKNAEEVELRMETTLGGQQSTVASKIYRATDIASGTEWSQLQVSAVAPTETLRVLVVVQPAKDGSRDGAVKFDQASLSPE